MSNLKLKIQLLGQPLITFDQHPVNIKRRQTRSLLYFLAANEGMVGRADLIGKYFGDQDVSEEVARRRLRELISKLRQELQKLDVILTANDQVGLDASRVEVDVLDFDHIYALAQDQLKKIRYGQALPAELHQSLEKAIGLWRGSTFLQGVDLGDMAGLQGWLREENSRLEEMRELILNHLAGHAVAVNDLESAAHWLRMALEPNQFTNIEGVYRLLKILKNLGRLNEASKIVNLVKKRYETDLEDIPQELDLICNEIINRFTSLPGNENEDWGQNLSLQIPMVGRQKELEKLKKIYEEKGMVIVWGEAGLGKTRLVNEFYRTLSPSPRLMVANCHQMEQHQPYLPLTDMLQQFITPYEWDEIDDFSLFQLERFIPNIFSPNERRTQLENIQTTPGMINEAIANVLELASEENRLLLFMDNVQWCDESSLNALMHLIKNGFFNKKGFLILTGLLSEKKPAFDAFFKKIDRSINPYEIIFLETLGEKETIQLATHILGFSPSLEFCRKLEHESGGNPFVLVETLRWYLEKNSADSINEANKDISIPSNVSNLLRERLSKLDRTLRHVIKCAAIAGPQFNIDSVTEVSELRKEEVVAAFEKLEDFHLIIPAMKFDVIGGYVFTYPRMRSLLLNELSTGRKQMLNQRMATWLETQNGQRVARPVVLAQYFEYGGNDSKAFENWLLAAEQSLYLNLSSETETALKAAERILSRQNDLFSDRQILQFFNLFMDYCEFQNDIRLMEKNCWLAVTFGQQRKSQILMGLGLRCQSVYEYKRGKLEQAVDLIKRALQHLEIAGYPYEIYRANNLLGTYLFDLDDLKGSRQIFQKTYENIEEDFEQQPGDLRVLREQGRAEIYLGRIALFEGLPQKGIHFSEQAIEHLEVCFDYHGLVFAHIVQAEAYYQSGFYEKGLLASKRALKSASSYFDDQLNINALLIYSRINIMMGNLDDSWQALEKANQLCNNLPLKNRKAEIYLQRSMVYSFLRNHEKSNEECQIALTYLPNDFIDTEIHIGFAINLFSQNRITEGFNHAEIAYLKAKRCDFGGIILLAELLMQIKTGRNKNYSKTCQYIEEISEKAKRRDLKQILLVAYYLYGIFTYQNGMIAVAQNLVQTVVNQGHQTKYIWIELAGLVFLQKIYQRSGWQDDNLIKRTAKILDEIHNRTALEPGSSEFNRFSWEMINDFE